MLLERQQKLTRKPS